MNLSFITFGCRLNRTEALDLEARFTASGHISDVPEAFVHGPDMIVVRGCSVTAKAQRDCEREIARLKRRYPNATLKITGCLPQAENIEAPAWPHGQPPPLPFATSRAYLKVQDGCNGACTYCIVPSFRGPPVSVPFGEICARASQFLDAGYRELVVTGCNLALYRNAGHDLPGLLEALALLAAPYGARIRLGSLEPGLRASRTLPLLMARHANICRFLHLSLQSACDGTLARMRRPYAIDDVKAFIQDACELLGPRLALGADVITGFPGESEEAFEETRRFLENPVGICHGFVHVHAFPYSERPGTVAAELPGAVDVGIRRARAKYLLEEAEKRRLQFAETFDKKEIDVCVEKGGNRGWSGEYLPVRLASAQPRRACLRLGVKRVSNGVLYV